MKSADTIRTVIEEKLCPIHDVHPVVDIINDEITAACCCEYFQKYCTIEISYLQSRNQYKRPVALTGIAGSIIAKRAL